jgi:hypothetical protein
MFRIIGAAGSIASIMSLVVALLAFRRKRLADRQLEALQTVPPDERSPLVEKMFDRLSIATAGLTREGKLKIAQQKIQSLSERLRLIHRTFVILAVLLCVVAISAMVASRPPDVYEIHVSVLDPERARVEGVAVRATGGEVLQSSGGWLIRVPRGAGRQSVRIFAEKPEAFLHGSSLVSLGNERQPVVELIVTKTDVGIRGVIVNPEGKGVSGVQVSIDGYAREAVATESNGDFALPAHAADGQTVKLRVSKGTRASTFLASAGTAPVSLVWDAR